MGITGLYEVIGKGEVHTLADYAARHWEQHKRPLRIAVDEACWRFTNLTPEQVRKIQEGEPAANPVEKVILWRILRLLKLNVELIFVNDGPRRPWKRNKRGGGKLDWELIRLTRQLLDHLRVPHHEAPGEAEAECATLQALGIVDAVWSDDGDALMFGCTTLIRQHKVGNERVKDHIRIYEAKALQNKHDLDPDGLVLFAILAGGDYNTEGLRGCGPKTAALLAKSKLGLARALRQTSEATLPIWREMLQEMLQRYRRDIMVPCKFPEWRPLNYYRNPTISTDEQLFNLRGFIQWIRPIDQAKLRVFLRERFHFTTREYLKHIAPIFLTRRLVRVGSSRRAENVELGIHLKRTQKKKNQDAEVDLRVEAKITFSPISVVEIDLGQRPPEEDWTKFAGKDGTPYDPTKQVEGEILRCFLNHGLPDGALEIATPVKRKRKAKDASSATPSPSKKRKVVSITPDKSSKNKLLGAPAAADRNNSTNPIEKKRGRPKKGNNTAALTMTEDVPIDDPPPPPAVFRHSQALMDLRASIVDLDSELFVPESRSRSVQGRPAGSIVPPQNSSNQKTTKSPKVEDQLVPGQSISPRTLRELRAAAFLARTSNTHNTDEPLALTVASTLLPKHVVHEVIDLT